MKPLTEDAMNKLDQLITTLDPVISFLNQKISNKTITGQIDIQRIHHLIASYQEFMDASRE
jgi:hypothetical protein